EHRVVDHEPEAQEDCERDGDRGRMAERDRHEREQHDPLALAVQSERNREQPSHGGIDAVIKAEAPEDDPPPRAGIGHRGSPFLSMIFSENRYPPRIKCGAGFFGIMLARLLTDSRRNPTSSRRPAAAPDAAIVPSASRGRTSDRRRCRHWG